MMRWRRCGGAGCDRPPPKRTHACIRRRRAAWPLGGAASSVWWCQQPARPLQEEVGCGASSTRRCTARTADQRRQEEPAGGGARRRGVATRAGAWLVSSQLGAGGGHGHAAAAACCCPLCVYSVCAAYVWTAMPSQQRRQGTCARDKGLLRAAQRQQLVHPPIAAGRSQACGVVCRSRPLRWWAATARRVARAPCAVRVAAHRGFAGGRACIIAVAAHCWRPCPCVSLWTAESKSLLRIMDCFDAHLQCGGHGLIVCGLFAAQSSGRGPWF